jgi:hypothetical protein
MERCLLEDQLFAELDELPLEAVLFSIEEAEKLWGRPIAVILATSWAWQLRHDEDGSYSVDHMSDEELQQAAVEDLLTVVSLRVEGKDAGGDVDHLTRFLSGERKARAIAALQSPMVASLTIIDEAGCVDIHPDHMQDAMDFSGVWLPDWEPLTDGTVYRAGPGI